MLQFISRQLPTNIVVVGAGGTGSRLVPLLAQFIKTITAGVSPRGFLVNPTIYLVDDDIVEEKNLVRQNFIQPDVGKPKAAVLANRYSRAYGVNIVPVLNRLEARVLDTNNPLNTASNLGSNAVVILCVDSAQARREILKFFSDCVSKAELSRSENAPFIVDAGNEDDFGQVRFFNLIQTKRLTQYGRMPAMTPEVGTINYIPMDARFYESLKDNPGGSCVDMDQTLAINAMMATMIMGVVQNFYYVKPFFHYTMGVSLKGEASVQKITLQYLESLTDQNYSFRQLGHRYLAEGDLTEVIHAYRLANIEKLESMGLNPDGTLKAPPVPTPVKRKSQKVVAPAAQPSGEAAPAVTAPPLSPRRQASRSAPAPAVATAEDYAPVEDD